LRALETIQEWQTDADRVVRLQQSYLGHVADYAEKIGKLTAARVVEPGEYIETNALFLGKVARAVGDWLQERETVSGALPLYRGEVQPPKGRVRLRMPAAMPMLQAKLRAKEGTVGVRLHVPAAAFVGRRGRNRKLTLATDGFVLEGGGTALPRTRVHFVPPTITASEPDTKLKISDVTGAVTKGAIYRGFVWIKETRHVIAGVEIEVL
jgi:hypothetical protein